MFRRKLELKLRRYTDRDIFSILSLRQWNLLKVSVSILQTFWFKETLSPSSYFYSHCINPPSVWRKWGVLPQPAWHVLRGWTGSLLLPSRSYTQTTDTCSFQRSHKVYHLLINKMSDILLLLTISIFKCILKNNTRDYI